MTRAKTSTLVVSRVFVYALLMILPAIAGGQAWVPEKGDGTFSASFDYIDFKGHFQSDGSRTPEAASKSRSFLFETEYGVTDRLALTISLPIVSARYSGNNPPSDVLRVLFEEAVQEVGDGFYKHGFLDDQHYHSTVQDFRFSARYNLLSRPLVATPFLGTVLPSHDYAFVGESAPGRNLKEFQFGTDAARRLDPLLPNAYLDGQVSFAIPEASLNVRTNRANYSVEMGYSLKRKLAVRSFAQWQHTFIGLHFPADLTTPERVLTHERLLKANYCHLGGGAAYALSARTVLSADFVTFLSGSDTHYGSGVAVGFSRSFTLNLGRNKARQLTEREPLQVISGDPLRIGKS